jgi:glutamate-1-semialdehyde 2,1-aminomutase
VKQLFKANAGQIAGVIVEPVVGNAGTLIPEPGFLQGLRDLCTQFGAVLIFDEVMTGFRLAFGGAQEKFGITPDLTTLGKIIGGGLPCAAYGGKKEIMEKIAPLGPVYQAGTLSGNPLAMAAGLATLKQLREAGTYAVLEEISKSICDGILQAAKNTGWADRVCLNREGSMFTLFFCNGPIKNFADAKRADAALYGKFFRSLLNSGVYFPPSQFEAAFVNLAMERKWVKRTIRAAEAAFKAL